MRVASSVATRRILGAGVIASGTCFAVALVLELAGRSGVAGAMTDPSAVLDALVTGQPWGWAALGSLLVIATPAAALIATAVELARAGDRGAMLSALGVLIVLAVSVAVSALR